MCVQRGKSEGYKEDWRAGVCLRGCRQARAGLGILMNGNARWIAEGGCEFQVHGVDGIARWWTRGNEI